MPSSSQNIMAKRKGGIHVSSSIDEPGIYEQNSFGASYRADNGGEQPDQPSTDSRTK